MTNIYKIEALLAFISNYPGMKNLGKVKLMKLFYFIDFNHARKYGTPITYDEYVHLEHGPIPSKIKNLVDSLADDPSNSLLRGTIGCEFPPNTKMCKIIPSRAFNEDDKDMFSDNELKTLEEVCSKYKTALTEKIEDDSHRESPWLQTQMLEEIPYYLAARDEGSRFTEEDIKLAQS